MDYKDYSEEDYLDPVVRECTKCSGQMRFKGSGRYVCEECGWEYLTDFGKVKQYLAENGPKNAFEIEDATGVSHGKVYNFIRDGRVEVTQSNVVDKQFCASCGVALEFGVYCPECAKRMKRNHSEAKGVYNVLLQNAEANGEMRFAGKDKE